MPFEIMVVAVTAIITAGITAIVLAALITRSIQSRRKSRELPGGDSLTKTELRLLLAEAVAEATDPLYDKVDAIQRQLNSVSAQLPSPGQTESRQLEAHIKEKEVLP